MNEYVVASIEPELLSLVPGYRRSVLSCMLDHTVSTVGMVAVGDELDHAAERWSSFAGDLLDAPAITTWRSAFKAMGINPRKFRPSLEALCRRATRGDDLTTGNTLVDLGTAVTLAARCPVGMHTVTSDTQRLELRRARGVEKFRSFDGTVEVVPPGEVIYVDQADTVLTRRWAWRQGLDGAIAPYGPSRLAINIDAIDAGPFEHVAVRMATELLRACGADRVHLTVLDSSNPSATLRV